MHRKKVNLIGSTISSVRGYACVETTTAAGPRSVLWATLGVGTGLVAGIALERVGGRREPHPVSAACRPAPGPAGAGTRLTPAASARAVDAALQARAAAGRLQHRGRGRVPRRRRAPWLGQRPRRRTLAAARVARAVPGIETVINSILVRGEDDSFPGGKRVTDQSA